MHRLLQAVAGYIHKHALLAPGDRVGVAVSGGADSVALLRLLLEMRTEQGLVISAVHLNHCLRGQESEDDEEFVRSLASGYLLPLYCARRDVNAHAQKNRLGIETAARELRYRYFEDLLREGAFNKLATAHTLDDQAETVLLKLSRGSGTRGLAGIYPSIRVEDPGGGKNLRVVRPLLEIERRELEAYLRQIRQPWHEDSTNADLYPLRNRIRHEILPKLIAEVNPDIRRTLSDTAQIARADEQFWAEETRRHLPSVWSRGPAGGTLNYSQLLDLPPALQSRLVRASAESIGLALEFHHVQAVLGLTQASARTALHSGWIARRHKESISFESPQASVESDYEYLLSVPGSVELPQSGLIVAAFSPVKIDPDPRYNPTHLLDARFARNLKVRNWRAGDRFWPSNRKAPKKIKELLQDRHIRGREKKCWPVISSGEEVIWVRGFGVHRDCRALHGNGILISEQDPAKGDEGNQGKQCPHSPIRMS